MKRYVEQLLEDLRKARNYNEPPARMEDLLIQQVNEKKDHFADVEMYVNGERQPLSKIIGIEKDKLPSPEYLTDEQATILADEMEKLWKYFHFYPSYPDDFPGMVRYKLLRDQWDSDQVYLSTGAIGIEFCEFNEDNCPVPEYCKACKRWKEEHDEMNDSIKELNEGDDAIHSDEKLTDIDFRERVEKAKQLMKTLPVRAEYISGIYNYCDRWCEKCAFTSRCLNFAMGEELYGDSENPDITNKAFWEQLSVVFHATSEFLAEKAEEMGIDIDAEMEEVVEEEESEQQAIKNNLLLTLADEYAHMGHRWFEDKKESLENAAIKIPAVNESGLVSLKDAIEVIQWYNFFIYVKLRRALDSLREEKEDFEMAELMVDHTNGTAKIALIAIDRSISAFGFLLENMRDKEDDILKFLVMLGKIRNITEKTFPRARDFKRPGFDE